jgi:uridine kinase
MAKGATQGSIVPSRPRTTARVTMLNDGAIWSAPVGTRLEDYFRHMNRALIPPARQPGDPDHEAVIAALVDGALRELTIPVNRDIEVRPVLFSDSDGLRIYRRALSFLMTVAARELFPDRKIRIDHSLLFGGFYCAVKDGPPFSEADLAQIKARMREIVEANVPIRRAAYPLDEARALFEAQGDDDKIRLLESRKKPYLILYELRGFYDYYYGYMVPSTGYLTVFDLAHDGEGFILRYPRRQWPNELLPMTDLPKLRQVFIESSHWLGLLGIEDVGDLNAAIRSGRSHELVLVAEALHEGRLADIADAIVERQPDAKLVLIAGPSSSGKTTSSKRLAIQLLAHGLKPYTLAMDNFFVSREDNPRDEEGNLDFEHLHAVDLDRFNADLLALMAGEEVQLPRFDFIEGRPKPGEVVRLTRDHIIIVEGIHALNPELVAKIPPERIFRLYVSCLTQLNIDRRNRVPTTDVRLLRRIVRDARMRGYSALDTLTRWPSVRQGERRWIFPFQENADMMFNSALVYELAVLRTLAEPLLLQIEHNTPQHLEAKRLLSFLNWVEPLPGPEMIPGNSLLREFVGDGSLENYIPGKPLLPEPC